MASGGGGAEEDGVQFWGAPTAMILEGRDNQVGRERALAADAELCEKNKLKPVTKAQLSDTKDKPATIPWGPNTQVVLRSWGEDRSKYTFCLLTSTIIDDIKAIANRCRTDLLLGHRVAASCSRFYSEVTTADIVHLLGMLFFFSTNRSASTHSISALELLLKTKRDKPAPLNTKRFQALMHCLIPSNDELNNVCWLLRSTYQKAWSGQGAVAVDETLYSYQPDSKTKEAAAAAGDRIPLVYIPRKPHKNGLLVYHMACKSEKTEQPYLLDIEPRLSEPSVSPREAFLAILKRWECYTRPIHVVADAAFGATDAFQKIPAQLTGEAQAAVPPKILLTFSMSTKEKPGMWRLLEHNLPQGRWRACSGFGDALISVWSGKVQDKQTFHHLATNAFVGEVQPEQTQQQPASTTSSNTASQAAHDELNSHTVLELRAMLTAKGLKAGGNKNELINRLLRYSQTASTGVSPEQEFIKSFCAFSFSQDPPHHIFYRKHFNSIDKHDKLFYRLASSFHIPHWRTKMLLSILLSAVVNSWVLYREEHSEDLPVFVEAVGNKFMDFVSF
jgi:hypothetical protein